MDSELLRTELHQSHSTDKGSVPFITYSCQVLGSRCWKTQRPRLPTAERSLLADSRRYRVPVGSAVGRVRAYEQRVQPAAEAKSEALKDSGGVAS